MGSIYYTIYRTVNTVNNKWYIGYHSTENLHDEYLGSGKLLKKAIVKYGREVFRKEILYVFPTREEALEKEYELVTEAVVKDDQSYNLKTGGEGGWGHIKDLVLDHDYREKRYGPDNSERLRALHKEGKLKGWTENMADKPNGFSGKTHSSTSRKQIAINNGNKLDSNIIQERLNDIQVEAKTYGYISRLAKKWEVSHTQVRRFISKYWDPYTQR